jgi:hypothetical protein
MKKLVIKNASCIKICSFLLVTLFVFSCTKEDAPLNMIEENPDVTLKSQTVYQDYCLDGTSNFYAYALKEHRLVSDGNENFLLMTAKFSHVRGHNYLLETEESLMLEDGSLMLFRKVRFDVKMMHGGLIMFSWPETWWELGTVRNDVLGQLLEHTGCIAYGPGTRQGTLRYRGHFDGENFYAATRFIGKQINPEPAMPLYWNIDGPVRFVFSLNLSAIECLDSK